MRGLFAAIWSFLCSFALCRHLGRVPGPPGVWISHTGNCRAGLTALTHTHNPPSSLEKLEMSLAFGEITQLFPAGMCGVLRAETDMPRLGEGWLLLGGFPAWCLLPPRFCFSWWFQPWYSSQCPVSMSSWSCLCGQAGKPSSGYLCEPSFDCFCVHSEFCVLLGWAGVPDTWYPGCLPAWIMSELPLVLSLGYSFLFL